MQKIISVFQRNYDGDRQVRDELVPGAEWVAQGEGVATRKWDGIALRVQDGVAAKRYDARAGRTPPPHFEPLASAPDPHTGHWPGWVPLGGREDDLLREGLEWGRTHRYGGGPVPDGTYEVCGPRIGTRHGANPEALTETILVPHGADVLEGVPRTFVELREYLRSADLEGIVFHHPDGRRAKIKKSDYNLARRAGEPTPSEMEAARHAPRPGGRGRGRR